MKFAKLLLDNDDIQIDVQLDDESRETILSTIVRNELSVGIEVVPCLIYVVVDSTPQDSKVSVMSWLNNNPDRWINYGDPKFNTEATEPSPIILGTYSHVMTRQGGC